MIIHTITPHLKLLNLQPPIPGFAEFIGAYLFTGEKKAIVDVGPRAAVPNLLAALKELEISPREIDYIVLTHIHIDHAGGTGTVIKEMPNAGVIVHPRGREHLIAPAALWEASVKTLGEVALQYGRMEAVPAARITPAEDGMKLDLGGSLVLEIFLTPGHAAHHLSVFDRQEGVLIAGETAGVCLGGILRPATPPPFRLEAALSSLDKLIALRPERVCFGHFGCYDNGVENLSQARRQLLTWYDVVKEAVIEGKDVQEIISRLRVTDPALEYLDHLNKDEYRREYELLLNSVRGMMGAARSS